MSTVAPPDASPLAALDRPLVPRPAGIRAIRRPTEGGPTEGGPTEGGPTGAPPAARGGRGSRILKRVRDLPWSDVYAYLASAAADGVSKEEAIEVAAILLDGAVDFEERVGGFAGRILEANDRAAFRHVLSLAWDLVVRTRGRSSGEGA